MLIKHGNTKHLYENLDKTPQAVRVLQGASASGPARAFAAVLQLFCPAALLPGLLRCLCRLLLPLSTSLAFIDFYCLCRLSLPLSDVAVVVYYADFDY